MPRSTDDLIAQANTLADRFEGYMPKDEDRGEPAIMGLRRAAYRRAVLEGELVEAVRDARKQRISWARIGREIGTSGGAARQRYASAVDA